MLSILSFKRFIVEILPIMNILKLQKRNIGHKNNNYNLNENDEDNLLNESNQINNEFLEN